MQQQTTANELLGFYSCGFAIQGLGIILNTYFPIFLDLETTAHSFSYYPNATVSGSNGKHADRGNATRFPCWSDDPFQCYYPDETAQGVIRSAAPRTRGFYIFMTIFVIGLVQLILLFSLASFAYFGNNRKQIFMTLSLISCALGVALLFTFELTLACTTCFVLISAFVSTANMFSQSFYPSLVQNHPEVLYPSHDEVSRAEAVDRIANSIASTTFFYSYGSSSLQLFIGGLIAFFISKSKLYTDGFALLLGISFSAIWGFICLLGFTNKNLKVSKGPDLPPEESKYLITWKRYRQTWTEVKKFPSLRKFLRAWLVFNIAFSNLSNFAFFFVQTAANLSFSMSLAAAAALTISTGLGSFYGPAVYGSRWLKRFSAKRKFIFQMILFTIYSNNVNQRITLKEATAIIVLIPYGLIVGCLRASVFTIYSDLIPSGYELELFNLLDVNEIFGSMIGALIAANGNSSSLVVSGIFSAVMILAVIMFSLINLQDAKLIVAKFNENQKFIPLRELTGLKDFDQIKR